MQPEQVATFLDLAETGSFHRSAERLGLTQSTVSARIAALEAALGCRLFTRGRAGARLTTEGLKFSPHARALTHAMAEARRAVAPTGDAAASLRIGIQNDLAGPRLGPWVEGFRRAIPDCAFYIEPDYSAQMCRDLVAGALDFAVIYSPHADPDLHFTSIGELRFRMVAQVPLRLSEVRAQTYIRANYSAAFSATHAAALPQLAGAPLAAGQETAVSAMLATLGGAAYVLDDSARALGAQAVEGAPVITQPVFAATHLRHRTSPLHRALLRVVQRAFAAG
jgi:DNA-binding transcriptional LysR family regulator